MQQPKQIELPRETQTPTRLVIPGLLVVTPAVVFYGLLFKLLLDLPIVDDYWAVLGFANRMAVTHGTAARFQFFLASQQNEYKLFFVHALVLVQTTLLGHVNFAQLSVLGDSAALIIAVLLWSMFLPGQKDLSRRLAYFVPVSWILFELQYFETLNWAMASLQNLWVIVFSLGTIRYLGQGTRKTYGAALTLYILAIAASGNGFLLLPVGLLMLLVSRQYVRAAGWITVTSVCVAAYAYHWDFHSTATQRPVIVSLLHTRPDFVIAFVGNAGAIAGTSVLSEWLSIFLGLSLLVYFAWLLWRGYFRRNPPVGYCVLFLLLTAAGVGGIRSEFGLMQSLASRYIIYGLLLVIFAWMAVVEEFFWTGKARCSPTIYICSQPWQRFFSDSVWTLRAIWTCRDETGKRLREWRSTSTPTHHHQWMGRCWFSVVPTTHPGGSSSRSCDPFSVNPFNWECMSHRNFERMGPKRYGVDVLDSADNEKLLQYYRDRKAWLVEPDAVPVRMTP